MLFLAFDLAFNVKELESISIYYDKSAEPH
jgi:hypothetical protein